MRSPALLALGLLAACDPCAGTPSCRTTPELSYTGQVIEFPSGRARGGVAVTLVRRRGPILSADTVRAMSGGDGFFVLRASALTEGVVIGDLVVTPAPPLQPYTVRSLELRTHSRRGDGGFLGRIFVNPFVQFIGELHDALTFAPVPDASVVLTHVGPQRVEPASATFTTTDIGRFTWEPTVLEVGDVEVEYVVTAPGYPRSYRIRDTIRVQYRDALPEVHGILVGSSVYYGVVRRRGTKALIPGVTVDFLRTGGVPTSPESFTASVDASGGFRFPIEIQEPGTLLGRLTVRPPSLPPESHDVALLALDGQAQALSFDYGPATILRPRIVYRSTGRAVEPGTRVRFTHVGGLADVIPAPWGVSDGVRLVDTLGVVAFDAATSDSGTVLYDLEVRLNPPHAWETVRIAVTARSSDVAFADTLRVGPSPGTAASRGATRFGHARCGDAASRIHYRLPAERC